MSQVTFLMPVYNGMPYLAEAIQSVLRQPGDDWELLLVDDQSNDGSWEYLQTLHDPRIRLQRNGKNQGLYGTLDATVREVRTPWTAIIFQDDLLEPNYREVFLDTVRRHPGVSFFWAAIHTIDGQGQRVGQGIDSGREELIAAGFDSWRGVLLRGTVWTISGSWTRTASLQKLGFRSDLPHLGDYELILRALWEDNFLYVETPLTSIREHPAQASFHNLTSFRDLRERAKVIGEQLGRHTSVVPNELRLRMLRHLVRGVLMRTLGRLRQGQFSSALRCFSLLPRAVGASFSSRTFPLR